MLNAPAVSGLAYLIRAKFSLSLSPHEELAYAASPSLRSRSALMSTSIDGPIVEEM
jgi:hypothetical protein